MSHDTDLLISVPRSCITEFYSKYLNLVETFYYVTLSENKSVAAKEKPEYVYFHVLFNLSPTDGNFNPREIISRIQTNMVREYKRKTDGGRSYSNKDFCAAVQAVRSGTISGYKAAKIYNIPRMTIMDHVHGKRKENAPGRPTALPLDVERDIACCLHTMEKNGFGLSRAEVAELVGEYVKKNNLSDCFKNKIPGKDWLASFQKRHNMSVKKPQAVEYARKTAMDPFTVQEYFDLLRKTILELGIEDKPSAIWNLDETSFSKDPRKTKIVGLKGHASTRTISTPGKDNTTVLLGASAAGEKTPPLIVFKGKYVWDEWTSPNAYPGTAYAATKNGWMETTVFEAFFNKVFLSAVGNERPVLLIYDGHASHVGLKIIEEARKENITILKLPPHTSHILQPLDISVMKSFKDRWDMVLVKWQRLHVGTPLPKNEFSRLIGQVWAEIEPQILLNGFRKAGIYPHDPTVIEESKFDSLKLSRWKKQRACAAISDNQCAPTTAHLNRNPESLLSLTVTVINKSWNPSPTNQIPKENMLIDTSVGNDELIDTIMTVTLPQTTKPTVNITFEELLLQKVKRDDTVTAKKRSRVALGAEVITHDDVVDLKRQKLALNIEKCSKKGRKSKITNLNTLPKTSEQTQSFIATQHEDLPRCLQNQNSVTLNDCSLSAQPGPSGIVKLDKKDVKNIKRENIKKRNNNISLLSKVSTSNDRQTFIATDYEDLPSFLQTQTSDHSQINILSNVSIQSPAVLGEDNTTAKPGPSGIQKAKKKDRVVNKYAMSITIKGKGVGKKSSGKENTPLNSKGKINYGKQVKKYESSSSTSTSVSGKVSSHNDSDIAHIESDDEDYDIHDFVNSKLLSQESLLSKDVKKKNVTHIKTDEIKKTEIIEDTQSFTLISKYDDNDNDDIDNNSSQDTPTDSYLVNDYVLVRYYGRKWTYYVGVIEAIHGKKPTEKPYYLIKFFKTVKKPKLVFKITKKIDRDEVPQHSIVKKVELSKEPGEKNCFFLNNPDNAVYFN